MAKTAKTKPVSWSDFEADDASFQQEEAELENEEQEEEEQEEEEEEKEVPKGKVTKKKVTTIEETEEEKEPDPKTKKKTPKADVEETIEEEEEEDKDKEKDPAEEADPSAFFDEVEKITGQSVEVDYKDVDPVSPQGVALREKAIREQTLDGFLTELEEKYPVAFKALHHAYAGGDISELFKQTTSRDYTKLELKEGDEVLAKEVLKEYYRSKGVKNEAKIAKMVEADEDSSAGLVAEAEAARKEMAEEQLAERDAVLEQQKKSAEDQKKRDQILITAVDDILETRTLGSFRIPDRAEAQQFKEFVMQNLRRRADGKYDLAVVVDPINLEKQLQAQYFQFKKGDLSKIVTQRATTITAQKLQLRAGTESEKKKRSTEQEARVMGGSLKDFED